LRGRYDEVYSPHRQYVIGHVTIQFPGGHFL